jgi:hypothetical protein
MANKNYGIGNTYPSTLVRRAIVQIPISKEYFLSLIDGANLHSFWGHGNTIQAAKAFIGIDVTPKEERPAIVLNADNLPTLFGILLDGVFVISPTYAKGYRPAEGKVASPEEIIDWHILYVVPV